MEGCYPTRMPLTPKMPSGVHEVSDKKDAKEVMLTKTNWRAKNKQNPNEIPWHRLVLGGDFNNL